MIVGGSTASRMVIGALRGAAIGGAVGFAAPGAVKALVVIGATGLHGPEGFRAARDAEIPRAASAICAAVFGGIIGAMLLA